MRLIDTHTHLDFPDFDADRGEVLARSRQLGVERLVVLGVYQANWQRLWDLVQHEDGLYAAFGLHPVYLDQHQPEHLEQLRDWLPDPALYAVSTYVSACVALVARLNPEVLDWFGTSMGGLIGMGYACLPNNPIRKLILNDVGPTLNFNALQRIGEYVGKPVQFQTLDEARNYIRTISQPFGPHTESQWSALTDSVLVQKDQYWIPHYDPAIGQAFQNLSESTTLMHEAALWAAYDAIKADTLVVRGEQSALLNHLTVENMRQRGPKARVVEVQGVGHAPTFVQNEQIHLVRDFLL